MNGTSNVKSENASIESLIGMPFHEVQSIFPDYVFAETEVTKYGLCGGATGYDVSRNDTTLFFLWEHWEYAQIGGIILLSPEFVLEGNLHVGMKLNDLLNEFSSAESYINMLGENQECIYLPEHNCWIQFETDEDNRIAEYSEDQHGENEFVRYIDLDASITSIMIKAME